MLFSVDTMGNVKSVWQAVQPSESAKPSLLAKNWPTSPGQRSRSKRSNTTSGFSPAARRVARTTVRAGVVLWYGSMLL